MSLHVCTILTCQGHIIEVCVPSEAPKSIAEVLLEIIPAKTKFFSLHCSSVADLSLIQAFHVCHACHIMLDVDFIKLLFHNFYDPLEVG